MTKTLQQERGERLLQSALHYKREYYDTHRWTPAGPLWSLTTHTDPVAKALFTGHYSCRQSFVRTVAGPGEKLVLIRPDALLVWVRERFRKDGQEGVNCSVFRNIGQVLSSELIREGCDLARAKWPGVRLFTFVDPLQVQSSHPGYCYLKAGWRKCGRTGKGLLILENVCEGETNR